MEGRTEPDVVKSRPSGDLHGWVLSLPWVVERPTDRTQPGVRLFAVDCEPLDRRQMWLVTGLGAVANADDTDVAAIMPRAALRPPRPAGWVERSATPLPAGHVLVILENGSQSARSDIETFVLAAYNYAMS